LDLPSVNGLWTNIKGAYGLTPSPEEGLPSVLLSPAEEVPSGLRDHILVVEDNEADVFLIQEAVKAINLPITIHVVADGEQAVRFFDEADSDAEAPCPAIVILDINLPRKQGDEVLKHMRMSRRCGGALVIAVSTSDSARDRESMKKLGANVYFQKPSDYAEFMKLGDAIRDLLG
jgi:DNA-binding response OmpR family regulator